MRAVLSSLHLTVIHVDDYLEKHRGSFLTCALANQLPHVLAAMVPQNETS